MHRLTIVGGQGFNDSLERGILTGHPISGCKFVLEDGAAHQVDSSELAFRLAAQGAFKEAFPKGNPVVLEPVMKVDIVAPLEFQGESRASSYLYSACTDPRTACRCRHWWYQSAQGNDRRY